MQEKEIADGYVFEIADKDFWSKGKNTADNCGCQKKRPFLKQSRARYLIRVAAKGIGRGGRRGGDVDSVKFERVSRESSLKRQRKEKTADNFVSHTLSKARQRN